MLAALDPVALWSSDLARAAGTAAFVATEARLEPRLARDCGSTTSARTVKA